MVATFLEGNSQDVLQGLPENYFHCVVTSPPYFGLRVYSGTPINYADGWNGMLGNEPTPDSYISHLTQIFREVRRVLRPDGVCWLNIGDSWAGGKGQSGGADPERQAVRNSSGDSINRECDQLTGRGKTRALDDIAALRSCGIKPKDMVLIPSLLALALRADGWYVRSLVIWAKGVSCSDDFVGNPMPESVNGWRYERHKVKEGDGWVDCAGCLKCSPNDGFVLRKGSWRPTDSYEFVLMLTKTGSYYCDREAVIEPYSSPINRWGGQTVKQETVKTIEYKAQLGGFGKSSAFRSGHNLRPNPNGHNLRSVLEIPTSGTSYKHYATYPVRLVEILAKASTSEVGCCSECGSPYARVVSKPEVPHDGQTECKNAETQGNTRRLALLRQAARERGEEYSPQTTTIGWRPTCACNADVEPCRVLDPFSGAGTTSLVAERLGLDSFGIDTSAEYIKIAEERLAEDKLKNRTPVR